MVIKKPNVKNSFKKSQKNTQVFVVFPASRVGVISVVQVSRCFRSMFIVSSRVRVGLNFCVKQKSWEDSNIQASRLMEVQSC